MAAAKLCAADDERRQAKRNSLADKLAVEAMVLADLKVKKVAVEAERRTVEADLGRCGMATELDSAATKLRRLAGRAFGVSNSIGATIAVLSSSWK